MSAASQSEQARSEQELVIAQICALVAEVRANSLWFLNDAFQPESEADALRALRWIECRADRETYLRARELREWLLRSFSAASVG